MLRDLFLRAAGAGNSPGDRMAYVGEFCIAL